MKSYSGISQQAKQAMRASFVKKQAKAGSGKHNRRNIDVENSQHIDPDRIEDDAFMTWLDTEDYTCEDFDEATLRFYEIAYGDTLKRINDNYVKDRHPEKQKTMEEYLAQHMPEEFILQIGNVTDNVDADTLVACVEDYLEWEAEWNKEHGYPFEVLTMALHDDEATPHIHGTRAWKAVDKHGNIIPNREKALEQAGVELPNPGKKVSRYNNRNVTFTAMCRDKWLDICEEHGFDIIREPIKDVKSKNKGDFIREREKDYQERLNAVENAQKALIEVEIQQNAEQYAIDSISLILDDKAKAVDQWAKAISKEKEKFEAHVERGNEILAKREKELNQREVSIAGNAQYVLEREQKALKELKFGDGTTALDYVQKKEQDYQMALRCKYGIDLDESLAPTKPKVQSRGYDLDM